MLRIMQADGFEIEFTSKMLDSINLVTKNPDLLILHGMPNDRIELNSGGRYDPVNDSWAATTLTGAPSAAHHAVR